MSHDHFDLFKNLNEMRRAVKTPNGRRMVEQGLAIVNGFIAKAESELIHFHEAQGTLIEALKEPVQQ